MLGNKQLKYLKSLHHRKFRQKYANFLAEGVKTGVEIINDKNILIESVFAVKEWIDANQAFVSTMAQGIVQEVSERELSAISLLKSPNEVVFILKQKEFDFPISMAGNFRSLYLDEIRDPGNMGTILRIADWFGVNWVFLSNKCVEVYNPKVIQSSMGAFLRIKTALMDLQALKEKLPDLPIIGMTLNGDSVFETILPESAIIVIGNESKGISSTIEKLLTQKIAIPRHPEGRAESLNAAVATGIICSMLAKND